jgi:hypothetical protein
MSEEHVPDPLEAEAEDWTPRQWERWFRDEVMSSDSAEHLLSQPSDDPAFQGALTALAEREAHGSPLAQPFSSEDRATHFARLEFETRLGFFRGWYDAHAIDEAVDQALDGPESGIEIRLPGGDHVVVSTAARSEGADDPSAPPSDGQRQGADPEPSDEVDWGEDGDLGVNITVRPDREPLNISIGKSGELEVGSYRVDEDGGVSLHEIAPEADGSPEKTVEWPFGVPRENFLRSDGSFDQDAFHDYLRNRPTYVPGHPDTWEDQEAAAEWLASRGSLPDWDYGTGSFQSGTSASDAQDLTKLSPEDRERVWALTPAAERPGSHGSLPGWDYETGALQSMPATPAGRAAAAEVAEPEVRSWVSPFLGSGRRRIVILGGGGILGLLAAVPIALVIGGDAVPDSSAGAGSPASPAAAVASASAEAARANNDTSAADPLVLVRTKNGQTFLDAQFIGTLTDDGCEEQHAHLRVGYDDARSFEQPGTAVSDPGHTAGCGFGTWDSFPRTQERVPFAQFAAFCSAHRLANPSLGSEHSVQQVCVQRRAGTDAE